VDQLFYLQGSWHNGTRKWFWVPFTLRQCTRTETDSVEYTRDNAWRKFRRNINFIPEFIFCLANMKSGQDGHYNGPNTLLCNISTWANTAIKSRLRDATSSKLQSLPSSPEYRDQKVFCNFSVCIQMSLRNESSRIWVTRVIPCHRPGDI